MIKSIPRIRFAHLPTPLEPLPRLSTALGGPRLWVKRDDQTGLALGGNKTRKLEFLLAEAQANGARTLVTAGALQSNHCRQTAAAAARYGFDCILVLEHRHSVEPPIVFTGNLLLDRLFGAEIVWTPPGKRSEIFNQTFENAWAAGRRPYRITYGGSSPTGAASYAFAVEELVHQWESASTDTQSPDWIVFASSSGGTQAGLVAGAKLCGLTSKVLGISVDEPARDLQELVADLSSRTTELLGNPIRFTPEDIQVNAEYLGGGYGVLGEVESQAIHLFALHEGLLLDPVYTGRAAGGMIDLIRKGFFKPEETVLFWHTGGTPALFADQYQDLVVR